MPPRMPARSFGPRRAIESAVIAALAVSLLLAPGPALAQPRDAAAEFPGAVRPLLEKYCFQCHGPKKQEAEVNFAAFANEAAFADKQDLLLDAVGQLRGRTMPPKTAPQPAEDERQRLAAWFAAASDRIDQRAPPNAGRVPLHRLNRVEYNNTIRDLLGVDVQAADAFPSDDVAFGFDNVAEVLALPPLLLEKYLDAAEKVLDRAIIVGRPATLLSEKYKAAALERARPVDGAAELKLDGELPLVQAVPDTDEYVLKIRAWQKGGEAVPATLVLLVDGVDAAVWSVPGGPDKPATLETRLPLREGRRRLVFRHTWHTANIPKGTTLPDIKLYLDTIELAGPAKAALHKKVFFVEPGGELNEREAARQIVQRFASRAFRRPAQADEVERLLRLYDASRASERPHAEAVRLALVGVLVSPHFLFRVERDTSRPDQYGAYKVNDWELASRLSYFLWSTMPDDELLALAGQGKLGEEAVLHEQVQRMLADPKALALVENFGGQWLGLRKLDGLTMDRELFPAFSDALARSMAREALLFFEHVLREDRGIQEFVNADWTYLNEDLARLYGIRGVRGGEMRKVTLTDPNRGGVMTMAAVLTITSQPTRTSAVKRGKWILEEILGAPPPPPPPNVPELEETPKGQPAAATLRERMERHRSDPKCYNCHVKMDTLGLGLENFDAIGRWRDKDGAKAIDAKGTLPEGQTFQSPAELKKILAGQKEEFARTFTEKMLVYALGRGLARYDRREVQRIASALSAKEGRFSVLVQEIVDSYPFRFRKPLGTMAGQ